MYLDVWGRVTIDKSKLLVGHQVLAIFDLHKKEIIFFRFLILKETMKFFITLERYGGELTILCHYLVHFLRLVGLLKRDDFDFTIIS